MVSFREVYPEWGTTPFAVTLNETERAYREALSFDCRSCNPPVILELGHLPVQVKNALVYGPNGEVIEFLEENAF